MNPVSDPSLAVATVLTFLEEVSQPDSPGRIALVALLNLLAVRITVRLVTLTPLGCLLLFRSCRQESPTGAGVVQGERTMEPYTFTYRDVAFRLYFGYPSRYQVCYGIQAERGGEQAYGWIRYAQLDLATVQIECLEFFEGSAWLREVFADPDVAGWALAPAISASTGAFAVVPEDVVLRLIAAWMLADYQQRFYALVALLEAGYDPPPDYRILWYYELCRACEIHPCEEPTPGELAQAFRLVEAHTSFEVREHAARARRQAKLQRRAQELGRWNTWVGQHLHGLERTSVFPISSLRSSGYPVHFATSRYDVAVTYEPIQLEGDEGTGYLETVADGTVAYVPRPVAQRWYRERWQRERGPASALHVLNCILRSGGKGMEGDDYMGWIFEREGEDALVALARSGAPIPAAWNMVFTLAIASKYYRIPVSVLLEDEHYVGYGVPGIHAPDADSLDGLLQDDAWDRLQRLHCWVFIGEEERGIWPTAGDIAAHQRDMQRLYSGLPVAF